MKKFLIVIIIILCILGGVMYAKNKNKQEKDEINTTESKNVIANTQNQKNTNIVNESTTTVDKVDKNITQEEAEKILEKKYGTVDTETGNTMSYAYITKIKDKEGKEYYAFRESWLVDNNHLSFLQNIFVSLDGKKIETTSVASNYEENQVVEFDKE